MLTFCEAGASASAIRDRVAAGLRFAHDAAEEDPVATIAPTPLDDAAIRRLRSLDDEALRESCELQVFRGSGPGGQKRNKTSSGVRLIHRATGISAVATVARSQQRNLAAALANVRLQIALHVRCSSLVEPTRIRLLSLKSVGYAQTVAVAFDVLAANDWSLSAAAAAMSHSTSQLGNWLAAHPPVLAEVNRQRRLRGLRPLRPRE